MRKQEKDKRKKQDRGIVDFMTGEQSLFPFFEGMDFRNG